LGNFERASGHIMDIVSWSRSGTFGLIRLRVNVPYAMTKHWFRMVFRITPCELNGPTNAADAASQMYVPGKRTNPGPNPPHAPNDETTSSQLMGTVEAAQQPPALERARNPDAVVKTGGLGWVRTRIRSWIEIGRGFQGAVRP